MDKFVTFYGEDGKTLYLEFLDSLTYKGNEYILMHDLEGSAVIFRCDPDGETYSGVDNQELADTLLNLFRQNAMNIF